MASEVIYVTIDAPTVESVPTTVGGSPTNVVDVDVIGDYNDLISLINNAVPTGTIIQGGWTTEPTNFKFLNGQTLTGGVAAYPALASYYPSWVSGADIVLPDMSGLVMLGTTSTAGTRPITSNAKTVQIGLDHLPQHTHSVGTYVTGTESQGHVHYAGSAHGNVGGWVSTIGTGGISQNHYHTTALNFWVNDVASYGFASAGSSPPYAAIGTYSTPGTSWVSHDHSHAITGYTTGADRTHNHGISGSSGYNTTNLTALPYNTTPAHMLVKFAVKL